MHTHILFASFLLFFLPLVTAAEQGIFSGTIIPGSYNTSTGTPFILGILPSEGKVSVKLPDAGFSIDNNTCSRNERYEACANNIAFSHYDYDAFPQHIIYKTGFSLTRFVSELDINRTINRQELLVGGKANYSAVLRNPSSQPALNVSFIDNLTEHIDIFLQVPSDCTLTGSVLAWNGDLGAGKRMQCYALLQGKTPGSAATTAAVTYDTGIAAQSLRSVHAITVRDYPLRHTLHIAPPGLAIGDLTPFTLTLSADENLTLTELLFTIPDAFTLRSYTNATLAGTHTLRLGRTFVVGEPYIVHGMLQARKTGNHTFSAAYVTFIDGLSQRYTLADPVAITAAAPDISLRTDSAADGKLTVLVNNPTEHDFRDVRVTLASELPFTQNSASFSDLSRLGHQLFTTTFAPRAGSYNVTLHLSYSSVFGEQFTLSKNATFTIGGSAARTAPDAEPSRRDETLSPPPAQLAHQQQPRRLRYAAAGLALAAILFGGFLFFRSRRRKKPQPALDPNKYRIESYLD